jgi:oligopeptide transport system substrate-binding protein
MKRLVLVIAGVLLALLIAVGGGACGGGSSGSENGTGTSDANGSSSSGSTLRLAGGDPMTLDPALATDAVSASYIVEIFGGLVTLDKDLQIAPDIAESWDVSPDGTAYTFHLRQNVFFHGGSRVVTAADFKYSMERAANPDTASLVADAYLGDIVGAKDMIRGRASEISGIEVVDDFTLRITIDQPKPYFLAKLTYPTAFVVDRTQVEADPRNWTKKPRGTGPYMLKEWKLGEKIVLEANDRYHLGAPSVQTVEFLLAGGSVLTMYENDEIDVSGVSINDIDRVTDPSDPLHADYQTADELSISYLGFNTEKPPFDDVKVRQAFGLAIDREKIAEVVLMSLLPVANSIMPPGVPGYNPSETVPAYDPEKAKQLLAESKYGGPDGLPEVTVTEVGAGASAGLDLQAMVEMWKDNLGVDVQIQQTEEATFWQDLDKGAYQMFTAGWIMDYPDPEDVLDILFYSQSRQNSSHYSNPQVDDLLLKARTELDTSARMALYQQAEQMILDDVPWIPLYYGRNHALVKPYVKDFLLPPMVIPRLRYVTIAQ